MLWLAPSVSPDAGAGSAVLRAWCAEVARRERPFRAPCLVFMSDQSQDRETADHVIFYTHPMSRGRIVRWMLEEIGRPHRAARLRHDDEGGSLSRDPIRMSR